jgi:hypothetical protein
MIYECLIRYGRIKDDYTAGIRQSITVAYLKAILRHSFGRTEEAMKTSINKTGIRLSGCKTNDR